MSVHSLPMKSRKRLAPGIFYTLPRILALFMTSLMQTAGHKMAALMVMCCNFQTLIFLQTGAEMEWKRSVYWRSDRDLLPATGV